MKYHEKLMWASTSTFQQLAEKSGCLAKCLVRDYRMEKRLEETVTWRSNWSSAFYLEAKFTSFDVIEEYWAFDFSDTINGIGGVMTLFLGWSLYLILHEVYLVVQTAVRQMISWPILSKRGNS